ncbi:catechol 2,3-dioxygenase [Salsuginibacillus halophilus]|uniref:Catechol 2,3-dioxygenase n=1 Tax=Salsuginibacillus halophilus TaxID=517424 RepID=A0A2P8H9T3_9BACI|nr:VOC family protein [Salsuginibacillus halophilus]PSL42982.1 catechol 2,3-dioxygenase [Salsuginibacillus halophilus]
MPFHRKPTTFVSHVHLHVQNLERTISFYQDTLGFHVLYQTDSEAAFSADGETALITAGQPIGVTPKERYTTGLYHFALLLPTRKDLAKIVTYFNEIGLNFGSSDHTVSESIYLADPDGNGIEIYADRDPDGWTWENGEVNLTVDPLNYRDLLAENDGAPWKKMPEATLMGHVHLHAADLEETEDFYLEGLGFEMVRRFNPQTHFIADGKYHHHIALNTWHGVGAPAPSPSSAGMAYFTLNVADKEKQIAITSKLESLGTPVTKTEDAVWAADPSGTKIKIVV